MKDRFDLEQEIMDCWKVTDEINMVTKHFIDSPQWEGMSAELADALMNKYYAISELYELKFQLLFETFGDCISQLKVDGDGYEESTPYEFGFKKKDGPQMDLRLNDVTPAEWNSLR